jgi:hypothetical protein
MISAYVLALLLVLGAIRIFQQTDEDVYMVLAATITIVCFVISLAHAHWITQLTIVLSLCLFDRFLRLRTNP